MNADEVALLLAKVQAFDRRTVGRADVLAWAEALDDMPAAMAMRAVTRWYRDRSGEWLDPGGLRQTARTLWAEDRQARLDALHDRQLAAIDAVERKDRKADVAALLAQQGHNLTLRRRDRLGRVWAWACTCGLNPPDQDHPDKSAARTAGLAHVPALVVVEQAREDDAA